MSSQSLHWSTDCDAHFFPVVLASKWLVCVPLAGYFRCPRVLGELSSCLVWLTNHGRNFPRGGETTTAAFGEIENARQNLCWYAAQSAQNEARRKLHVAIRAVQGMSLSTQRAWLESSDSIPPGLLRYLHPELQVEWIEGAVGL